MLWVKFSFGHIYSFRSSGSGQFRYRCSVIGSDCLFVFVLFCANQSAGEDSIKDAAAVGVSVSESVRDDSCQLQQQQKQKSNLNISKQYT